MTWHHCEVVGDSAGRPWLKITGSVLELATEQGVVTWHLSLTHDGDVAIAYVIAESG
jgi:holo-[acyl-carrier protein] synthase